MRYSYAPSNAACPVCGAQQARILYGVTSAQAAQHFILREQDVERHDLLAAHIASLWGQPFAEVVTCAKCEFCFSHPFAAGDARFYELAYPTAGYPGWRWEFTVTLKELRLQGLTNFRLLEVGAGKGSFLRALTPQFTPKENVLATEFSPGGRDAIQAYGVRCLAQDVRTLDVETARGLFDVICLFQVLEHLDRLPELFNSLYRLGTPSSQLILAVPNGKRTEFNELHDALLDMPPNHIGRWNKLAFQSLERYGWKLKKHCVSAESWRENARVFSTYAFLRASQNRHTLPNRIERIRTAPLRRVMQAGGVAWYAFKHLIITGALREHMPGGGQWVSLTKM